MDHSLGLASASAVLTTAVCLLTGIVLEPMPAAEAARPPRALTAASAESVPARAIRMIPIDGRYGPAVSATAR